MTTLTMLTTLTKRRIVNVVNVVVRVADYIDKHTPLYRACVNVNVVETPHLPTRANVIRLG